MTEKHFTKGFYRRRFLRKFNHIIDILKRYPYGVSRKKVMSELNGKESEYARAWSKLKDLGIIKSITFSTFVLVEEGLKEKLTQFSTGKTPDINLHSFQISLPILEDKADPKQWDRVRKHNWEALSKKIKGMTIHKNTKHVQVWLWARQLDSLQELEALKISSTYKVATMLWKYGVSVDIDNVRIGEKHIAIRDDYLKKKVPEGTKVSVYLGRPQEKMFPADEDKPAKAWTDESPFRGVETNDVKYAENYLRTPERVEEILEIQLKHAKNIELHMKVLEEMSKTLKDIRDALKKS